MAETMKTENLPKFILILVAIGLLVGIGIVAMSSMGDAIRESTTIAEENVTITTLAGATTYNNITSVSRVRNSSNTDLTDEFTITLATGVIATTANITDGAYNISYIYKASTSINTAIDNASSAIGDIPNTWLSLIVTVAILAIILMLVVRAFGNARR